MSKIKKIKIYTHHKHSLNVGLASKKVSGLPKAITAWIFYIFFVAGSAVLFILKFIKNSVIATCFHTGNAIIKSFVSTFRAIKKDILTTRETLPKRARLILSPQFNKALLSFLAIAVIGWGALESLRLVAKAFDIKSKIMHTALIGNLYLNQAKDALSTQDLSQAQSRFSLAYQTFTQGEQDLAQSGQALNKLLSLIPQKADADRLISAATLISQAGQNFVSLEQNIKTLKISGAGIQALDKPAPEVFQSITDSLNSAQTKLTQAAQNINSVNANNLPENNRVTFLELKDKLNASLGALNNFNEIFALSQSLLKGDKNLLLLFENNNELRATGGFMGSFGALKLKDGQIQKINVSSIYDLDGQLTANIQPPTPVLNLGDRWTLRDSNWFASFPESAKKITDFYEKEGGETPDIIITLTPDLIVSWLKITGPIAMPKYGITLTDENFVEQTQAATTISDNLPTNAPKQILADLVPVLLQKISEQDKNAWPEIIQSLQDNLNSKQIVIFSRDPDTQSQLQAFHWTGEISQSDRDYLSIVNSNLGGTKTDLFVDQQVSLNSTIADDGTVTNTLQITRTNKMPKLNQTNNLDFMRIYVPLGAKLISNTGFDYKTLDTQQNQSYQKDDDVYNWEKNSVRDVLTGTVIGQESGKTFFGNWLNINGAETKVVKLVYQLPFKVNDVDRYSLLLQKQIGAEKQTVNWSLNFSNYQIAWKNFDPDTLNTSDLNSAIILDKDYFLGIVLQKR